MGLGAPSVAVGVDPESVYLVLDATDDLLLVFPERFDGFLPPADHVQCGPRQHAGHGVEVRRLDITAQPCGLEGNLTRPGECVCHTRPVTEAHDAKLFNQLRHGVRVGLEVPVDPSPNVICDLWRDFFRTACGLHERTIRGARQRLSFDGAPVSLRHVLSPRHLDSRERGVVCVDGRGDWQYSRWLRDEVVIDSGN